MGRLVNLIALLYAVTAIATAFGVLAALLSGFPAISEGRLVFVFALTLLGLVLGMAGRVHSSFGAFWSWNGLRPNLARAESAGLRLRIASAMGVVAWLVGAPLLPLSTHMAFTGLEASQRLLLGVAVMLLILGGWFASYALWGSRVIGRRPSTTI